MNYLFKFLFLLISILILVSCSITHKITRNFKKENNVNASFKGFVLYNPSTKEELINYNGQKYFTPASNTKLFTFYAAYKALQDSVASLAYYKSQDSLIIKGTADPSFLYGANSTKVIDFLHKETAPIYLLDEAIKETAYGSGWAWDDYQYYYMPEKNLFPIYGNIVKFSMTDSLVSSTPSYFKQQVKIVDSTSFYRELFTNNFYLQKDSKVEKEVPFITSNQLVAELLGDQIQKEIKAIPALKEYNFKVLRGIHYNELYKKMLIESDNFIAEQLLLQVGKEVLNVYSVESAIEYSLENYLNDIPQKPRWVDGSGLSRYNLFTPNNFVYILDKMYNEIGLDTLLNYFPIAGKSGTLKNWNENKNPYIFAKTGSLSNNYNLSGYLITKKGTVLIFSYMNNHYQKSTSEIKNTMYKTLELIYTKY
ncbi:MAG: D-alanyl-D-alanine carboxypeptidase [Lutibacter sp.]|uniref:D-alanyl-D-alanine carboxypeptidase n=1 Tax=Lutibacter sp. TaxID=1925666 RepID=UPI00185B3EAF|nr:D-alanyl-D-alanine carboxypeptidase [Lutibacter sp.]MBT8316122.1 D-alanyl-D-alanine carboxypeptidase [Lutibacter sp.]NNJ56982.1 D-alanyl-D-alanine carboxypeptidase [Lutibacter sp.]